MNQIEALQSCNNFHIFGICESFLNKKIENKEIEINRVSPDPFRADSPLANEHPRGGVCLYYKEHMPINQRNDLQILNECIVAEIKINNNKKMFYVLIYRSPSQSKE